MLNNLKNAAVVHHAGSWSTGRHGTHPSPVRQNAPVRPSASPWVGAAPTFLQATRLLDRYATTDLSVLLLGESGTGKELAARRLHQRSRRAGRAFVAENCTAIPETLLEAEFFGVKKGAFTGADRDRPGLFAMADGGTLFLDEIGDLPESLQTMLLRVLQEGQVRPVGGEHFRPVDVRVVCATHQDLQRKMRAGEFREDLYYRLAAATVRLPALRERTEDIVLLAETFLDSLNRSHDRAMNMSESTRMRLQGYAWPGNIRQLQNEVSRAFALSDGDWIQWTEPSQPTVGSGSCWLEWKDLPTMRELEKLALIEALRRTGGRKDDVARMLGISRASVYEKVRRYGL